jgi:hypothetical protein
MKRASAYQRKGYIVLFAVSDTTAGVGIAAAPVLRVEADNVPELGRAVLAVLEGSRSNVPHPSRDGWREVAAPVLKMAGVKSWNTFAKAAKNVDIRFDTNRVSFIPIKNLGPKNGFVVLPTEKVRTSAPTETELGLALIAAFGEAK